MRRRDDRGQAVIEVLALTPMLLVAALAAAQVLAAGVCGELAGHAAEAGAAAILQGSDPHTAARQALPGWSRDGLDVAVHGRRVTVRLTAPGLVPRLAALLASQVSADAGPAA